MARGIVEGYEGTVEYDVMDYGCNDFELYAVAICDPVTGEVLREERYAVEADWLSAIHGTPGRELRDVQKVETDARVWVGRDEYDHGTVCNIAYVVDPDQD